MRNMITAMLTVILINSTANAVIVVNEWNVNDTNKWEYVDQDNKITILQSDEDIFSFD